VVAPEFLNKPEVRRWLDGIEPAWTMLDFASYTALRQEPLPGNEAIRIEPGLSETDLVGSLVLRTARILLERAGEEGGLKLTATGNLARSVVAEMIALIDWPDFDKATMYELNKVINEPDFFPVYFVRSLLQATKLLRKDRDRLVPTRVGQKMVANERQGALQALLFHITFWHVNLGYFGRDPLESWPQNEVGIVLWSLSASANDWMPPDKLTRLCTVPVSGVLEGSWDRGSFAMEGRILRPLVWFGLLEWRWEGKQGLAEPRLYRKAPLFDRLIKFKMQIERPSVRH